MKAHWFGKDLCIAIPVRGDVEFITDAERKEAGIICRDNGSVVKDLNWFLLRGFMGEEKRGGKRRAA